MSSPLTGSTSSCRGGGWGPVHRQSQQLKGGGWGAANTQRCQLAKAGTVGGWGATNRQQLSTGRASSCKPAKEVMLRMACNDRCLMKYVIRKQLCCQVARSVTTPLRVVHPCARLAGNCEPALCAIARLRIVTAFHRCTCYSAVIHRMPAFKRICSCDGPSSLACNCGQQGVLEDGGHMNL